MSCYSVNSQRLSSTSLNVHLRNESYETYIKRYFVGFSYIKCFTKRFERNTGIEPASQAWEARALPMC